MKVIRYVPSVISSTAGGMGTLSVGQLAILTDTNPAQLWVGTVNGNYCIGLLKGDKGDKGDTGTTGVAGATGQAGVKGDAGNTGSTGVAGTAGVAGASGTNGTNGTNGINGTNATPNFRTVKANVPALLANATATITLTWSPAFADTDYVVCVSFLSASGVAINLTHNIVDVSQTTTSVQVRVTSLLVLAANTAKINAFICHTPN